MSSSCKILQSPAKGPLNIKKKSKQMLEEEKALRDQLHIEIENKTKACSNKAYECSLQRIDGYEYCIRHILQDPKAPYKQCTFTYSSNGKRCTQATPRSDQKKDYGASQHCFEHSRCSQLEKTKTSVGKFKSIDTVETLLNSLSHHVKVEKARPGKASQQQQPHDEDDEAASGSGGTSAVDPFLDLNSKTLNNAGRNILDFASDTSSDEEIPTLNNTWRQYDMDNSDNESVDSQNEDLLK
jgi:KAT8 regulatory NSL complex subunit 2